MSLGCRPLTETDDERRCQRLNAFAADTAQMRVGQMRQFEAAGFESAGPGSCVGAIRGGFTYSTDSAAIASVGSATGLVTARAAGTTRLRAHRRVGEIEYSGEIRLQVLP